MPGLVPDHVLEQIRHANDVVEVIGAYFPLKRAGANFRALCPFHKEKTPSFNVSSTRQIWHCFGCGEGGDVFKFLMKYENLDFPSAVQRLAERAGIQIEHESTAGGPRRDEKDLLLRLHENIATHWHQTLLSAKPAQVARDYLEKRGLRPAVVKRWRIGYALDSWDALIEWGRANQFAPDLLETAGLAVRGERGLYDRFRGRLMFPIADDQGRVVAFSGRILTDAKEQAKYVNSPETPIFHKGRLLFAFDRAKRAILDDKHAIVCEGQVDTIACHEAGFNNVVAPQGTALTEQHARMLKRYTDEVVLMFDGDTAGQNAAVRNAEPLWEAGFTIRVALLPEGDDPDSYLRQHGAEALRSVLAGAPGFFDFLLQRLSREHDPRTERGKLQIAQQMVGWLCRIGDPILQATFAQKTAARLEVREEVLRQVMRQHRSQDRRADVAAPVAEGTTSPAAVIDPAEELLLRLIVTDDRALQAVRQQLDYKWLSGSVAGEIVRRVLELAVAGEWNGPSTLLTGKADDESSRLLSRLLLEQPMTPERLALATKECLTALERRWLERESQGLRRRMGQPGLSAEDLAALQQQFTALRQKLDK